MMRIIVAACIVAAAGCADRRQPAFAFTELAYPGAASTVAAGINAAGDVVGWYRQGDRTIGFTYSGGKYTSVEYPGAALTQVWGIASNGEIVGSYRRADETEPIAYHGFLRNGAGQFLDVNYPGHKYGMAVRLLDDGTVVGCYHDHDATTSMHGTTIRAGAITAGGVPSDAITIVETPGSMNNGGSSDSAKVVGMLADSKQAYVIERGNMKTFEAPNATRTEAWDVNASGVIVGAFDDAASVSHGYLLEKGTFTTIDFPEAKSTIVFGINDRGTIVGAYEAADGQRRGFIATRK